MAPLLVNGGTPDGKGGVPSEKSHRGSIKNRTKGLFKKAYELATLCDVELALVCYPSQAEGPTTWPPDRSKIENTIHRYFETPAHKKLSKNQITLDNPNLGAEEKKDAAKLAVAKPAEEADRLLIPFPDDEDKLTALEGILESRLEAVRRMIVIRRTEGRTDPRPSARDRRKKLAIVAAGGEDPKPSAQDAGIKHARDQSGPPPAVAAVTATSPGGGDPRTSDRDRGKKVAGDYHPVWELGYPSFPPPQ